MRLRALYQPVRDLARAVRFYSDLGLEPAWEDDGVAAFTLPGSSAVLMLSAEEGSTGPLFVVPSVVGFFEQNNGTLAFVDEPRAIGPGMFASFTDPSGNLIRIMDDTTSRERS